MNNEVGELAIEAGDVEVAVAVAPLVSTQTPAPLVLDVWPTVLEAPVGVAAALVSLRNPGFRPITVRRVALLEETEASGLPGTRFPFALRAGAAVSFYLYFYPTEATTSWLVVRVLSELGTTEVRVEARGVAPPPDAIQPVGTLERALIDDVIGRNMGRVSYCYLRERQAHPELEGRVVEHFVVAADGSVSVAETASTTMNNASVETCLNEVFLRLRFPSPEGGGGVGVSYPLIFEPQ